MMAGKQVKSLHIHRVMVSEYSRRSTMVPDMEHVYLAIEGKKVKLYPNEIGEAVKILTKRGLSINDIATLLGCCSRTVVRHRSRLRKLKELK